MLFLIINCRSQTKKQLLLLNPNSDLFMENLQTKFRFLNYGILLISGNCENNNNLHCVAKVYPVLPFSNVKCLCSGGQEWGREGSHSHWHFNIWILWYKGLVIWIWQLYLHWLQNANTLKLKYPIFSHFTKWN